jgi:hypothetical protein
MGSLGSSACGKYSSSLRLGTVGGAATLAYRLAKGLEPVGAPPSGGSPPVDTRCGTCWFSVAVSAEVVGALPGIVGGIAMRPNSSFVSKKVSVELRRSSSWMVDGRPPAPPSPCSRISLGCRACPGRPRTGGTSAPASSSSSPSSTSTSPSATVIAMSLGSALSATPMLLPSGSYPIVPRSEGLVSSSGERT